MTDPAALVARTRRVSSTDRAELLALAGSDGILFARDDRGFAGRGAAVRCRRPEVADVLTAIAVDDEVDRPGTGPIAFGALPFLPDQPGELIVPSLVLASDGDAAWVTSVAPADAEADPIEELRTALLAAGRPAPSDGPSSFQVTSVRPPADWEAAVARATARIRAGELDKVVLAREVAVTADAPISIATVLVRLAQHYPGCYLYLVDGFCGASPELLVSRAGDVVRAQPMAGTKPRRGIPEVDAAMAADLLASATYRHEHQVTIDEVRDTLMAFSSYVDSEPEPSVVPLANVVHLATNVEGRLSHPPASVLELVAALHPTPAVCGRPRDAALALIAELEDIERGPYAGTVGWVDAHGNGEWAVSIRGAEIAGSTARVIAGNGMVGDSDPPTELIETRAKLQAMLSAIIRP